MSRVCPVLNKRPMSGNNVSHANNKTRRRFLPNLQIVSFYSEKLSKSFKFRLSARAIKTIDYKGGLDLWLQDTSNMKLPVEMQKIKKLIMKK